MANEDERKGGSVAAEEPSSSEVGAKGFILPPTSTDPSDFEYDRVPYSNEMLLLSFEGHLKPLTVERPTWGEERPSYAPVDDLDITIDIVLSESPSEGWLSKILRRLRNLLGI